MCRSPMEPTVDVNATAVKMNEVIDLVRLACAHRSLGCDQLLRVHEASVHEAECPHAPDIRCLVSVCQWTGVYDGLFNHVCRAHGRGIAVALPVSTPLTN